MPPTDAGRPRSTCRAAGVSADNRPTACAEPVRTGSLALATLLALTCAATAQTACWTAGHDAANPAPAASGEDAGAPIKIACAQERDESYIECGVAMTRDAEGNASATVTFPNGFRRTLFFEGETFVRADATMSGSGRDTDWQLTGGLYGIRVDDQCYVIPQALLAGER